MSGELVWLEEWRKEDYAICHSNSLEGRKRSHYGLLFLPDKSKRNTSHKQAPCPITLCAFYHNIEYILDFEHSDMVVVSENEAYKPEKDDLPVPLSQAELNNLTPDLNLSKESALLLGSIIKKKHILAPGTTFDWYRNCEREFRQFLTFRDKSSLFYCNNITELIQLLGLQYDTMEWRLFIDSSSISLKEVLLHNGNSFHLHHLGIQYKWKRHTDYFCLLLTYKKANRLSVEILKWLDLFQGSKMDILNLNVFYVSGIGGLTTNIVIQVWQLRQWLKPGSYNVQSHPLVTEQNTASILTYQVRSNEYFCEGNRRGRQWVCFTLGEVLKDENGETQGRYIWRLVNKRTNDGPNIW